MSWFFKPGGQSISFSISPSNKYSGLISFRIDWFNLLAVQGNLKSLLQHHSLKASILQCSAFFIVQLSHPYLTTGKTIALTKWTFVGKVMSLLFNMLSSLVIAFLPRSKMTWCSLSNPMLGAGGYERNVCSHFKNVGHWPNYHGNSGMLKLQMWVEVSIQYLWTTWKLREASC